MFVFSHLGVFIACLRWPTSVVGYWKLKSLFRLGQCCWWVRRRVQSFRSFIAWLLYLAALLPYRKHCFDFYKAADELKRWAHGNTYSDYVIIAEIGTLPTVWAMKKMNEWNKSLWHYPHQIGHKWMLDSLFNLWTIYYWAAISVK